MSFDVAVVVILDSFVGEGRGANGEAVTPNGIQGNG